MTHYYIMHNMLHDILVLDAIQGGLLLGKAEESC